MRYVIASALSVLMAQAGQPQGYRQSVDAAPGEVVEIRLDTGGDVRIVGTGESSVHVEAWAKDVPLADMVIEAKRTSRGVEVVSRFVDERRRSSRAVEMSIRVPRRVNVEIASKGGVMSISDVEGSLRASTMGGGMTLTGLSGRVTLSSMSGDIRLTNSRVDGTVSTMSGDVVLEDVTGGVRGSSMNGRVIQRNTRLADSPAAGATEVRISTMRGDIDVPAAPAGAAVSTMNGDVRIRTAAGHARASTMRGDIRLDAVDGWIDATTMGGDVTAVMVGNPDSGDRHVRIVSQGGNVTLTVPAGLQMRIDAKLTYTRNNSGKFGIGGDIPLQIRETAEWDDSDIAMRNGSATVRPGGPHRSIHGTSTVGDGRHLVEIETVNGDVTILTRTR